MDELREEVHYSPEELKMKKQLERVAKEDMEETREERVARYKREMDEDRERRIREIKSKAKRLLQDEDTLKDFYNLSDEEDHDYFQQEDSGYGLFDEQVSKLR